MIKIDRQYMLRTFSELKNKADDILVKYKSEVIKFYVIFFFCSKDDRFSCDRLLDNHCQNISSVCGGFCNHLLSGN